MGKTLKEAKWWELRTDGVIQCELCPRHCVFKEEGDVGACGVRMRIGDKLVSLIYGKTSGWAVDPIEKKPLFHFYPGSAAFSIGTVGCNFFCLHCQNWFISQARFKKGNTTPPIPLDELPPKRAVELAKTYNCTSIAYTYNEPLIFAEYVYDTAKLAEKEGIKNVLVTNGYVEEEPLRDLMKVIDAANVDLKGDERFYREVCGVRDGFEVVKRTIKTMKENGIHVEVTCLIIPGYNDKDEFFESVAKWIYDEFGPDAVPLHFTAFYPNYRMTNVPPTPASALLRARKIAMKRVGLHYVYTGNILHTEGETTFCPSCERPVIRRRGFSIVEYKLDENNRCKYCGTRINIVGKYKPESSWLFFYL